LEPAVWGKPVLFGPHTDHCAEVAALLVNAQGGRVVQHEQDLAQAIGELLHDADLLRRMGQAARQVVADNQGALQRSADIIAKFLPGQEAPTESGGEPRRELSSRQS
jgi:3-deoxy-D-manno-octulosonic-acid transferase